jgi:hypothetical protein
MMEPRDAHEKGNEEKSTNKPAHGGDHDTRWSL